MIVKTSCGGTDGSFYSTHYHQPQLTLYPSLSPWFLVATLDSTLVGHWAEFTSASISSCDTTSTSSWPIRDEYHHVDQ